MMTLCRGGASRWWREARQAGKKTSLTELMGAREEGGRPLVRRPSGGSLFGTTEANNDFVMVDLKTPFAAQPSV